ncbi:signal peptidase I [Psychrobacillus sp. L4]|uniref:signal peptidase I n=1 Tax=Psychrobacillus sp. L4 TaxID=3236892 RepID=UPI0036F1BD32
MKIVSRVINTVIIITILLTLISSVGSAITKEPILLSVIRSNSMYPVWERGDMVIVENMKEKKSIEIGDTVFFKSKEGSLASKGWIAHRVLAGNANEGYTTKGDANDYTDQELGDDGPIRREWITGRALTIGGKPIVIPKLGYLSLWMEKYQKNPYILPIFAVILAVIIGVGELTSGQKRKKKSKGLELQLIYIIGGLTISVIMGSTMIASGQRLTIDYEVSDTTQGVLMGSAVGILMVGDEVTRPLSELSNGGVFKLIGTITTNDEQIQVSHTNIPLAKGQQIETTFTVKAEKPGKYQSSIQVGLFYPFLPSSLIYSLAEKSYWLALAVVSLLPGLPLMLYPLIDGKMRRKMMAVLRKKKNKLMSSLPF